MASHKTFKVCSAQDSSILKCDIFDIIWTGVIFSFSFHLFVRMVEGEGGGTANSKNVFYCYNNKKIN